MGVRLIVAPLDCRLGATLLGRLILGLLTLLKLLRLGVMEVFILIRGLLKRAVATVLVGVLLTFEDR